MNNRKLVTTALKEFKISYDNEKIDLLLKYLDQIYEYNKKINLVGTKDKQQILIRHIIDSLSLGTVLNYYNNSIRILDIGTGAGFPGLPNAIFYKNHDFYLLDSKRKSIDFINYVCRKSHFKNIIPLRGRAEVLAGEKKYREGFTIVVTRALSKIQINLELALPFCEKGGSVILYKGKNIFREIDDINGCIKKLGGGPPEIKEVKVPFLDEYRALMIIKKVKHTLLKYPRKYDTIKKSKLV